MSLLAYYNRISNFTGENLFKKPLGFNNVQYIQRVAKILQNYNYLGIDGIIPSEPNLLFAEKVNDEDLISFELFQELYEYYAPSSMKEFNSFMDIYPGCIGMTTNEKGQKVPIYEIDLSNND